MSELILRFVNVSRKKKSDSEILVSVHLNKASTDTNKFKEPLTEDDLKEIRWYLEKSWYWPGEGDYYRASKIEANLRKWGEGLFDTVFKASADAMGLYKDFTHEDNQSRAIVIETDNPRVLKLPWELLFHDGGYLFSETPPISVRRQMRKSEQTKIRSFELPVRILVVVSRPNDAGFIDPRSIAVPLLDALDNIDEQMEIEFLRPPTLDALDTRLSDIDKPKVHIVHFDGHGVYDQTVGLGFLLFEDEDHNGHRVDAEQLGTLLNKKGIPLVVLNACQSAQPDERNPFASVAARLIESGVGGVVAMNYSVLVEAAKRLTGYFYGALAKRQSVASALDTARRKLFSDTKRLTLYRSAEGREETIHLQDWFLPALYQQEADLIPFSSSLPVRSDNKKMDTGLSTQPARGGFPPEPKPGFAGRARELLALERIFAERHIIVMHGFGGQGKTSLASHVARWFVRSHLFERAVFLSFEGGAGLDYVINELSVAKVV